MEEKDNIKHLSNKQLVTETQQTTDGSFWTITTGRKVENDH